MGDSRSFRALKKKLYQEVGIEIERMVEYYAVKSGRLGDHIYEKQERILACATEEEAQNLYRKLMSHSIHFSALYLLATGKAKGGLKSRISEKAATKAEGLARFLEKRGNLDGARSERERARRIREEIRTKAGG